MSKRIEDLNLSDDFLFAKVMVDKAICKKVLEKILKVKIKDIVIPTTQRTIDLLLESKGVRLDVYLSDDKGTIYNVEMQGGKKRQLPKRSRYYQSCLDMDLICAGEPYDKLQKTYVIFICTFDPFHNGRHIYTFQNTCIEHPDLHLSDDTYKVFLNTKGKLDDVDHEMKEFLAYVENTTNSFAEQATSSLIKEIHRKVIEVKLSKESEVEYMTLLQRDRENIEIGLEEGERKMAELTRILLEENRTDDLKRILEDTDFRKKLFEEYQI